MRLDYRDPKLRAEDIRWPMAHRSSNRPARTIARAPARWRSRSSTAPASGASAAPRRTATPQGVVCAKVARYAERVEHPDRLTAAAAAGRPQGGGRLRPDRLGRGAGRDRRALRAGRGALGRGGRVAVPFGRQHGHRAALGARPPAPCQALQPPADDHLRDAGRIRAGRRASASSPGPIRARWRKRTSSCPGVATRSRPRSTR